MAAALKEHGLKKLLKWPALYAMYIEVTGTSQFEVQQQQPPRPRARSHRHDPARERPPRMRRPGRTIAPQNGAGHRAQIERPRQRSTAGENPPHPGRRPPEHPSEDQENREQPPPGPTHRTTPRQGRTRPKRSRRHRARKPRAAGGSDQPPAPGSPDRARPSDRRSTKNGTAAGGPPGRRHPTPPDQFRSSPDPPRPPSARATCNPRHPWKTAPPHRLPKNRSRQPQARPSGAVGEAHDTGHPPTLRRETPRNCEPPRAQRARRSNPSKRTGRINAEKERRSTERHRGPRRPGPTTECERRGRDRRTATRPPGAQTPSRKSITRQPPCRHPTTRRTQARRRPNRPPKPKGRRADR